jgi:hypothetical protein
MLDDHDFDENGGVTMQWRATIAIFPHSTGSGQEADRKAAGAEEGERYFYYEAQEFRDAVKMAECFASGIKSHPAVWDAPIMGVHRLDK